MKNIKSILPSGEVVALPVSSAQARIYRAFFSNANGGDCGCACGRDCYAYRQPFSAEQRLHAHANARQAIGA